MFGNHGLCGLLEEGAHGKSPKCLGGTLGDFGEFCKGLCMVFSNFYQKQPAFRFLKVQAAFDRERSSENYFSDDL